LIGLSAEGSNGLRLDPSLELFMQSLDRIRRADRFSLACRKAPENEELLVD
jgi:hypothetical protein